LGLDPIVFHTNINLLEDLDIIKHTLSIQCFTKDENESQIQKYNWSLLRAPHREYYISSIGEPRERAKAFVKAKAEIPF
jgi:hypothetical protein